MSSAIRETNLELPVFIRGKVRDVYDLGQHLLIIASDRISAFDRILPTPVPDKGTILTRISNFWFEYLKDITLNHIVAVNVDKIIENVDFPVWKEVISRNKAILDKRTVLVKKVMRINIECVVRGYLAGSGWQEYQNNGAVCGIKLPEGMKESDKLQEPIFTPSTKSEKGNHDINISESQMIDNIGYQLGSRIKEKSIQLYMKASSHALSKGVIIADTKFEFGVNGEDVILIDEVLTPDSSRFWDMEKYSAGKAQDSYDKQYVRDYLLSIKWNKEPPIPELPESVVNKTREKYLQAFYRLTGLQQL